MLRFTVFVLLVVAASATATSTITRVDPIVKPLVAPSFGVPEEGNIVDCGSQGKILKARITECTTAPCDWHIGKTYIVEVDFTAFGNHLFLTLTVSLIVNNEENVIINYDVLPSVVAGRNYTVAFPITITKSYAQGNVGFRIQVARHEIVELCGLVSAIIRK